MARQRLELWDVPADEIRQLEQTGQRQTYLTLRSPITGTVLTKNVFQGQYVTPQAELYGVADLSTVYTNLSTVYTIWKWWAEVRPAARQDQPAREEAGLV